jgi:hypothetical protein
VRWLPRLSWYLADHEKEEGGYRDAWVIELSLGDYGIALVFLRPEGSDD